MVVNNWFVTIKMYSEVLGNGFISSLFFVTFWCFAVLILLNVFIALILEIYSSVEPEVTLKAKKLQLTISLAKIVEGVD